jgi:hypothetical protein
LEERAQLVEAAVEQAGLGRFAAAQVAGDLLQPRR